MALRTQILNLQRKQGIHKIKVEAVRLSDYKTPWMYDKQKAALFNDARFVFVEATTKAGKTHGCILWLIEQAIKCGDGQSVWWVAPTNAQAKIAFRRMKRMIPKDTYTSTQSPMTIRLNESGALIEFKSGEKPDNLYGDDVFAAVMDEASRTREEAWFAMRSTLTATNGPLRAIGNVKGKKNWFYRMCRKAEAGEPNYHYAKLTAADAVEGTVVKQAEIDQAKRDLPEAVFNELYMAIPNEDGSNPFGSKIRSRIGPLSGKPALVFGVDLAKSVDYTVIIGLDEDCAVSEYHRFQKSWGETKTEILRILNGRPALIDSTGVGDPIVEDMQKENPLIEGFKFTSASKQQIMEGLAVAIQQDEITYPDGVIVLELESFEFTYSARGVRYSAPEGSHDDTVCALALARSIHVNGQPGGGFLDWYTDQANKIREAAKQKQSA